MFVFVASQAQQDSLFVVEADEKYFEDQFYIGINYNLLTRAPEGIGQSSFSYSFISGFIKDLPLNRQRNIGFGIGAGLSINAIYSDLLAIKEENGNIVYEKIPSDFSYNRNMLNMSFVEFPIEFRWRNSTADNYRFWRIYTGIKFSYLISGKSKLVTDEIKYSFDNPDIRNIQYGIYLNFGYNTWNFYAQYDLSNLFEDDKFTIDGQLIEPRIVKAGLIFYIL
ncbi:porin family protein [Galbibacter mesophilus]|uniref:porin family protein n=1 Tax=Galbibacter mesophilus TaxID=379069 RepID=UPI00191FC04F|nr:porin family protein [Galbibacter mesophilus]MCM5662577.1 PorT family protein [Galbibacter mesophilus]